MGSDAGSDHGLGHLDLLASAISRRSLKVAPGEPGELPWTDGRVIFVDPGASAQERLEALGVQASLLAAGSLQRDVVRGLRGRPALARRYLAVEGQRALAGMRDLLPPATQGLIDPDVAARTDSPAESLATARNRKAVADPPYSFGTIRVRPLLAALGPGDASPTPQLRAPAELGRRGLAELPEEEDADASAADLFSSPVGGGGSVGRWLRKLLRPVRRLDGGGPPGADPPTHRTRAGARRGAGPALATALAEELDSAFQPGRGIRYPEWDVHRRRYRPDWCSVQEVPVRTQHGAPAPAPKGPGLRRPLARLGMGLDRHRRQAQGDDVDIDAAVEARVEWMAGSAPDEAVYIDSLRRRRDLAVLLLLDISGSTAEPGAAAATVHAPQRAAGATVHEHQRAAAAALATALHEIGDRVALYAFRSQGRSAVHLMPVKRFDDDLDTLAMRRLYGLEPGAFSRMGAAIRHGAELLEQRAGTPRRLLVVLSDGLAYDHGYEPVYGAADARRALLEARRRGIGCLCLTLGASTDAEALRRVFGSAAHATIPRPEQLGQVIGPLFRAALRSAEARRRVSR